MRLPSASRRRPRWTRWDLLGAIPVLLVAIGIAGRLLNAGTGPIGLAVVFEELAILAALVVLAPVALLARAEGLGLSLIVLAIVGGCLFGSEWISLPGSGAGRHDLTAVTWNLEFGARTAAQTASQLEGVTADVVALLEVEPEPAAAIAADSTLSTRFPYRFVAARRQAWGLAVLSRYPIRDITSAYPPACLDLVVETPRGDVRVIVGHPNRAYLSAATPLHLPLTYDPSYRDSEIATIRRRIDQALAAGERVLVLGDFNTSPTEPEYRVLTAGLRDTHVEVGEGPGWTWRSDLFDFLPMGLLRIDLQLTAGAIRPVSTSIDCSLPGDHCRLSADYEIDG